MAENFPNLGKLFCAGLLTACAVLPAEAATTPQLLTLYQNVWSLNGGTNYYGNNWTNPSTTAYGGNSLTNWIVTKTMTNVVVYRSAGGLLLQRSAYGQPVESAVAQCQLGDVIPWPSGIISTGAPPVGFVAVRVGNNPAAYYQSTNPVGGAIYLPYLGQVIASAGGNVELDWATTNGIIRTAYTVSAVSRIRPAHVFWTEPPYNAPMVQMMADGQQVFACIHYNNYVTQPVFAVVTNQVPGGYEVVTNLANGVWLDGVGNNQQIRATGIEGLAVIEYYADGNFNHSLGIMPFQVQPPEQKIIAGTLGSRLLPSDLYYGTSDLIPNITAGQTGNKVLQYGQNGPKYNWVFALQPTVQYPWSVEIYWEHQDWRGVTWPFEVDWYSLDWPASPQLLAMATDTANSAPALVPSAYSVQIPYQDPANNAMYVSGQKTIVAPNPGLALLQYSTDSNIWFDAIEAVAHDDPHFFNPEPWPWTVGQEVTPVNVNTYALQLDGESDALVRPYNETAPTNFTIECWFRTASPNGGKLLGFGNESVLPSSQYDRHLYLDRKGIVYFGMYDTSQHCVTSAAALNDGSWHHVAGTFDGQWLALYVDGAFAGTQRLASAAWVYPNGGFWRAGYDNLDGWSNGASDPHFAGVIDEIRIWNYARSGSDISNSMDHALIGNEAGLFAYYPFSEGTGDRVGDPVQQKFMHLAGTPNWVAGFHTGTAESDATAADMQQFPGYVYAPAGTAYNVNLYDYPDTAGTNFSSAIFPVHTNGMLEVWWANRTVNADMTDPVYYPSLVERYAPAWPVPGSVPQIAIASGLGSAGSSWVVTVTNQTLVFTNSQYATALRFAGSGYASASNSSTLRLATNFSLEAWVYPMGGGTRTILAKGAGEYCFGLASDNRLFYRGGSVSNPIYSGTAVPFEQWSHVAVAFDYGQQQLSYYINGGLVGQQSSMGAQSFTQNFVQVTNSIFCYYGPGSNVNFDLYNLPSSGYPESGALNYLNPYSHQWDLHSQASGQGWATFWWTPANWPANYIVSIPVTSAAAQAGSGPLAIGRDPAGLSGYFNGAMTEARIWNVALSRDDIVEGMNALVPSNTYGLAANYSMGEGAGTNTADSSGSGNHAAIIGATWLNDPTYSNRSITTVHNDLNAGRTFTEGENASLYYQNSPSLRGFNPNEEHALILQGVVYALRSDLNLIGDRWSSAPFALVQYTATDVLGNPHPAMQTFGVVPTNLVYAGFTNSAAAGQLLQPPMPLAAMPGVYNTNTRCANGPGWRDRKNEWWARAAGDNGGGTGIVMRYWYPVQDGFFFPDQQGSQLAEGTPVPWLSGGTWGTPTNYTFSVLWPFDIPQLRIGQTLYTSPANSGLPDIHDQLSVDIVYQQSQALAGRDSVTVIDPIVRRGAPLDNSVIQQMAAAGQALCQSPGVTYTFPNAPPSIGSRLLYDPNQPIGTQLSIVGEYVTTLTDGYLLLNLIEGSEYSNIYHAADGLQAPVVSAWHAAVAALPTNPLPLVPNMPFVNPALSAGLGQGVGFVTVAFNNSTDPQMVPSALPISLSIVQVITNLYDGSIEVITSDNPLDEMLTLRQQADYAGQAGQYYFEWRTLPPTSDGMPPTNTPPDQWLAYDAGQGKSGIIVQGANLYTLVDNYFLSRYRPLSPNNPAGTNTWSDWALGFAPGWVQRAMNAITPFEQRLTDMVNNGVDVNQSMIEEAGGPYSGPVPLNMQTIYDFGLIQIYETILERARMLSIDAGLSYADADSTLKLAAGRLHDLYMLLGNEAYADAQDPTIAIGSDDVTYGEMASSLFSFQNQAPTLLEEELALLRGRDSSFMPPTTQGPFFNRLPWNFTRAINGGEAAYALNYNIAGPADQPQATITAADAEATYPQGHGDAWGHYLSAIGGYYSLLASPNFDWIPGISTMLLGGSGNLMVSVGYDDEKKFSEAAAALARTGADIVNRTYRKFYTENGDEEFPGYTDESSSRAWGVAEWACRAGQGSYVNWAVANSLLPAEAAAPSRDWALALTNANSYVDFGAHSLSAQGEMTLEMWIQSIAMTNSVLFGGYTADWQGNGSTNLFLARADGRLSWFASQDRQTISSTNAVADGIWHHVAFVLAVDTNGQFTRNLYVDGVLHSFTPSRYNEWANWQWALGAFQSGPGGPVGRFFQGNVDEVRIWNRSLSAEEVLDGMNTILSGREPGLVSYYPFLEGSGNGTYDQAGANQGTLVNAGWIVPGAMMPFATALAGAPFVAQASNSASLAHDGNYTVEAWMNVAGYPAGGPAPVVLDKGAQYRLQLSAQRQVTAVFGNPGGTLVAPIPLNTGTWVHAALAVAYDTNSGLSSASLYFNGQPVASGTQTGQTPNTASPLTIASNWPGLLNEVRLWTATRSSDQIADYFAIPLAGVVTTNDELAAYYRAEGLVSNVLADLSGQSNTAQAGNAQAVSLSPIRPPAPVSDSNSAQYRGILAIDRSTVPELAEIAACGRDIQAQLDNVDLDLNPLGLAPGAVPFDISPAELDQGKTHFEQIYERALRALNNALVVFDEAKGCTRRMREQANSSYDLAVSLGLMELDYHNQLCQLFGYPYSDDIGPTGTYPQGYDGPDLINYNLLDLESLVGTAPTGQPVRFLLSNIAFVAPSNPRDATDYVLSYDAIPGDTNNYQYADYLAGGWTVTVYIAENGLQVKPLSWTGRRQAQGDIQQALSDYIVAYYTLQQNIANFTAAQSGLQENFDRMKAEAARIDSEWTLLGEHTTNGISAENHMHGLEIAMQSLALVSDAAYEIGMAIAGGVPKTVTGGAGISSPVLVEQIDPGELAMGLPYTIAHWATKIATSGMSIGKEGWALYEALDNLEFTQSLSANNYYSSLVWNMRDFQQALTAQLALRAALFASITTLSQMDERYRSLVASGQRIIAERAQIRANAAQDIQDLRYGDMTYRVFRDELLRKYSSSFDLAARYAYLAAKAYDYETGLLSSDATLTAGQDFLASIARARAIGVVRNGEPQIGGNQGDPGLADILARMKANWEVLEPGFGFNNPDVETRRISVRTELMRTALSAGGDSVWQNALNTQCRVDNLYDVPEFKRFCKPFTTTTNVEPALVIPFSSTILAGQNFFGNGLAGGDNYFNPTFAATKIRSVGVWFFNYNNTYNTNSAGGGLATEPNVYLVPVGMDVQRAPDDVDALRSYTIVDQALPIPYPLTSAQLANPKWVAVFDSLAGSLAELRRYPAFRAFHENDANKYTQDDGYIDPAEMIGNARLVGRSVWNTRWLLIVPGRLLLADPNEGIERFIFGAGTGTGPSQRDGNGVKDIRILFHTYSVAGK